jgi:glycosyltransferase involved in cell wall biosynthesis
MILSIVNDKDKIGGINNYLKRSGKTMVNLRDIWPYLFKNNHLEYNSTNFKGFFILYLASFFRISYSIVVHGNYNHNRVRRLLLYPIFRRAIEIRVVSENVKKYIKKTYGMNSFVFNPFIPPRSINIDYPVSLIQYIKDHSPIVMACGADMIKINGIDLYGFDLCVELIKRLRVCFRDIGLIFATPSEKFEYLFLEPYVLKGYDISVLWPMVDLFIRPTYQDGNPLSVNEAIYFDVPVIASDCCHRPAETILFNNRNIQDLYEKAFIQLYKKVR